MQQVAPELVRRVGFPRNVCRMGRAGRREVVPRAERGARIAMRELVFMRFSNVEHYRVEGVFAKNRSAL